MTNTVFIAMESSDAGENVFGVFTTREAAISALRTRSCRGLGDVTIVTKSASSPSVWYLHNPRTNRTESQWVGSVSGRTVEGEWDGCEMVCRVIRKADLIEYLEQSRSLLGDAIFDGRRGLNASMDAMKAQALAADAGVFLHALGSA
jgi:hypothetical protein